MIVRVPEESALFHGLKEMILSEGYRSGDALPSEAKLIERFGSSRSSMREALKQLQTLGIVEIRRGIGTFVGPLSIAQMLEAIAVGTVIRSRSNPNAFLDFLNTRIAIDLGMAESICRQLEGTTHERLDTLVVEMIEAGERGENFREKDREFHFLLQSTTQNHFATDMALSFWDVSYRLDLESLVGMTESPLKMARTHGDILQAAYAGDVEAYRSAIVAHYEGAVGQAKLFAENYPSLSANMAFRQ